MHKEPCLCTHANLIHVLFVDSCVEDCDDFENDDVEYNEEDVSDRASPCPLARSSNALSEIETVAPNRKRPARSPTTKGKHGFKKLKSIPGIPKKKTKMAYTIDSIQKFGLRAWSMTIHFVPWGQKSRLLKLAVLIKALKKG
jgi:hypothetical protein